MLDSPEGRKRQEEEYARKKLNLDEFLNVEFPLKIEDLPPEILLLLPIMGNC